MPCPTGNWHVGGDSSSDRMIRISTLAKIMRGHRRPNEGGIIRWDSMLARGRALPKPWADQRCRG